LWNDLSIYLKIVASKLETLIFIKLLWPQIIRLAHKMKEVDHSRYALASQCVWPYE